MIHIATRIKAHDSEMGLSLVEFLVALIISALTVYTASILLISTGTNVRKTESTYDVQNLIDADISAIEGMADRYICNLSGCDVQASIPNLNGYVITSDAGIWNEFKLKCDEKDTDSTDGQLDLISPLKTKIENILPEPQNIDREITVHGTDSAQELSHVRHMTVQYRPSGSSTVLRDVTIMPIVSTYCP